MLYSHLYGEKITGLHAYGRDEFDFSRDTLLHIAFNIGEFGYLEIELGQERLYMSTDGITLEKPAREAQVELPIEEYITAYFVGLVLYEIHYEEEAYFVCFEEGQPLSCRIDHCRGYTDRDYFEVELFAPYYTKLRTEPGTLKRCHACKGQGDLFIDFVDDFCVTCRNCGSGTKAYMTEKEAIEAWNAGVFYPER